MACCLDGGIAPPCFTLRSRAAFDVSFDGPSTYLLDIATARISMDVEDGSRGNVVAASASNHVVKIYDRNTLCFQGHLTGHEDQITALQFAAESPNILWTASQDATLRCWDVRLPQGANQTGVIHSKHSIPFCSLALSPAGVTMAAGTAVEEEDAHIILWDLRSCQEIARFTECHSDDITQLAFNETAPRTLVSGSMDGLLCVFDTLNLTESESLVAVLNAEASVVGEDVKGALQGLRVLVYTLSIALNEESPYARLQLVAGADGRFGFAPAGSRRDQENCTCLYRVDVRMDRSLRTYLVSHTNGRQRLVWAVPALDHSSNDTQWPAPLPLWQLAVSDHDIRASDLESFKYTFALSGAKKVRSVVMSDGQQAYHLQHRSCDGAAILVQEAKFLAQLGFFGPSHEFVYALSHCETFGLWHSTEGTQYARLLSVRERIKELYGSPVDYFITCSYNAGSGRLFVLGGDHEGNLTILNAGTEGFAPLVVVSGGHSATIRCAHWDHEAGSLLTGSEDGFLCHWLAPDTDSSSDSSLSSDTGKVHCRSRQHKYSPY